MAFSYSVLQNGVVGALGRLPVKPQLKVLSCGCGLFGDIILSMNAIQFAERHGLSGSIHWDKRSLYFDPERGGNAHEYFFEESRFDFSNGGARPAYTLSYFPPSDNFQAKAGTRPRNALNALLERYARPRREIMDEVDRFRREELSAPKVLGVHIRRTDAAKGFEGRKAQDVENFVEAAEGWLERNSDGKIFLATDASDVADVFTHAFGEKVSFQNALRSDDGTSLHGHKDKGVAGSPYRKGREALVDALILSKCDFLIRCFSFVTAYSLSVNPDLEFLDLDKENMRVMRTRWLHE